MEERKRGIEMNRNASTLANQEWYLADLTRHCNALIRSEYKQKDKYNVFVGVSLGKYYVQRMEEMIPDGKQPASKET